jgi:hypothetical protein
MVEASATAGDEGRRSFLFHWVKMVGGVLGVLGVQYSIGVRYSKRLHQ